MDKGSRAERAVAVGPSESDAFDGLPRRVVMAVLASYVVYGVALYALVTGPLEWLSGLVGL